RLAGAVLEVVTRVTPRSNRASSRFARIIASPMSLTRNSSRHSTRQRAAMPAATDQRALPLAQLAQARVHLAHETVEVPAQRHAVRQAGHEQIHQEGLAATDAAPQVQPGYRFGRIVAKQRLQAAEQAVPGGGFGAQGRVHAVELGQQRQLGRIRFPAVRGDALLVTRAGREAWCFAHGRDQAWRAGGSQPRTACLIAPRRSISRRWKKWLVSGMRTSSGLCSSASTQSNTACGSTTSSASPCTISHGQAGIATVLKSHRPTGGAMLISTSARSGTDWAMLT